MEAGLQSREHRIAQTMSLKSGTCHSQKEMIPALADVDSKRPLCYFLRGFSYGWVGREGKGGKKGLEGFGGVGGPYGGVLGWGT